MDTQSSTLICKPDESYKRFMIKNFTREEDVRRSLMEELTLIAEDELEENIENLAALVNLNDVVKDIMGRIEIYHKPCKMSIQLAGNFAEGRVWLFEKEIFPDKSLKLQNHSPTGFMWGYGGSGPAQLALAICLELMGEDKAMGVYQDFKFKHIASLPQKDFEVDIEIDF
jgi:hypothetical protein